MDFSVEQEAKFLFSDDLEIILLGMVIMAFMIVL
jgi:hypothetical protein